jgi:TonB family protein
MRRSGLILINILGIAVFLSSTLAHAISLQDERSWKRVWLKGEEISMEMPVLPNVMIKPGEYYLSRSREMIFERRTYSAYANDFIFVIESYKTKNPTKLLEDILVTAGQRGTFKGDVTIDGQNAKQYQINRNFYGDVYYVAAKKHVYAITLTAMEEKNPAVARLLSSIKINDVNPGAESSIMEASTSQIIDPSQERPLSTLEVTRRAIIVWKPEPKYTDAARQSLTGGTVVLKAVLASNGQVTNIEVVRGLKDGLTEAAIEAARNMRFFPAEKDGKPVSQSIQVEYNFNIY